MPLQQARSTKGTSRGNGTFITPPILIRSAAATTTNGSAPGAKTEGRGMTPKTVEAIGAWVCAVIIVVWLFLL